MAYTVEDIQKVLGTTDNYYTPKERPVQEPKNKRYSVEDIEAVVGKVEAQSVPKSSHSSKKSIAQNPKTRTAPYLSSNVDRVKYTPKSKSVSVGKKLGSDDVKEMAKRNGLKTYSSLPQEVQEEEREPVSKESFGSKVGKATEKLVSKAFEGPKTFEEAKQNKNSQKSIANKPYSNVSEHVPSLEELMADAGSMKSLVAPKTKGQPKKKQASTYLSGDMQTSRGVPAAANKQADSSVPKRQAQKEFDAAQMETYMNPEYRMDAREKSGAKKYIEDYYKTGRTKAGTAFKKRGIRKIDMAFVSHGDRSHKRTDVAVRGGHGNRNWPPVSSSSWKRGGGILRKAGVCSSQKRSESRLYLRRRLNTVGKAFPVLPVPIQRYFKQRQKRPF